MKSAVLFKPTAFHCAPAIQALDNRPLAVLTTSGFVQNATLRVTPESPHTLSVLIEMPGATAQPYLTRFGLETLLHYSRYVPPSAPLQLFIERNRDGIIAEWLNAVHAEGSGGNSSQYLPLPSQEGTPDLLESLSAMLGSTPDDEQALAETAVEAPSRPPERRQQGSRLDEVLREITQLRSGLIRHLARCEVEPTSPGQPQVAIAAMVHRFLDDFAWRAARHYVEETTTELQRARQQIARVGESRMRLIRSVSHKLQEVVTGLTAANHMLKAGGPGGNAQLQSMLERDTAEMRQLLDTLVQLSAHSSGN